MTLVATPADPSANSYVTTVEALAYHTSRLFNVDWTAASTASQEAALEWATRLLDRQDWKGRRKTIPQPLRWPRYTVYDLDGYLLDSETIPQFLKNATCELALLLLRGDRTLEAGTEGFTSIQVGPIKLDVNYFDRINDMSPEILRMIHGYVNAGFVMERG